MLSFQTNIMGTVSAFTKDIIHDLRIQLKRHYNATLKHYVGKLQCQEDENNNTAIDGINHHLELTNDNDEDNASSSEMNFDLDSSNNIVEFKRSNEMSAFLKHWHDGDAKKR